MISPLAGIILGPYDGFISTLIAVMIGHSLIPRETAYEFVFTFGAPIGSMVSGFIFRGEWKKVFALYTIMLASYFARPSPGSCQYGGCGTALLPTSFS